MITTDNNENATAGRGQRVLSDAWVQQQREVRS